MTFLNPFKQFDFLDLFVLLLLLRDNNKHPPKKPQNSPKHAKHGHTQKISPFAKNNSYI